MIIVHDQAATGLVRAIKRILSLAPELAAMATLHYRGVCVCVRACACVCMYTYLFMLYVIYAFSMFICIYIYTYKLCIINNL